MTDLRDQLATLITDYAPIERARHIAERILDAGWHPPRNGYRTRSKATCHPERPVEARGLCKGCYASAWSKGTIHEHPAKTHRVHRDDFIEVYTRMRSGGSSRSQVAERLGMTINGVGQAYLRAVKAGLLTPDRRPR